MTRIVFILAVDWWLQSWYRSMFNSCLTITSR